MLVFEQTAPSTCDWLTMNEHAQTYHNFPLRLHQPAPLTMSLNLPNSLAPRVKMNLLTQMPQQIVKPISDSSLTKLTDCTMLHSKNIP